MLRSLCCPVRQTSSSSSNKEKSEKLVSQSETTKHQDVYRLRSLSASDDKSSPQRSRGRILEDIFEDDTRSTSLPRNYPDVTPKHQSLVTSTGGSSESVYKTPPTSRHPSSASSHPLNTMKSASRFSLMSTSKYSSLTRETGPTRERRSSQALLCKMGEAEQKRQQQHKRALERDCRFHRKTRKSSK